MQADLTDIDSLEPLLEGVHAVYLIWPNFDPGERDGAIAFLEAARRAGVRRLVYHSIFHPQVRGMPHHAAKDQVAEALVASGLSWRVLQPFAYAQNLDPAIQNAVATGRFESRWGLVQGQSLVDLEDVAAAATVLLTRDGLDGGTFEAAGPEPLTAPLIANLLGQRRLDIDVTAVDIAHNGPVPVTERCTRRQSALT